MVLACRALNSGHARCIRSGNAEGLLTWPPRMMNGLPSTIKGYTPLVLVICEIGLFCATASGIAAASTNSPLKVIIESPDEVEYHQEQRQAWASSIPHRKK